MRTTLLEFVQSILSDMDSEPVNSISDTIEAQQIASVLEDTYYNMVSLRLFPEHKELIKLIPLSDSNFPTHFRYKGSEIEWVKYNIDEDGGVHYREVRYCTPDQFLRLNSYDSTSTTIVQDKNAGTSLIVRNDRMPSYYTSFDQEYIVMDAYKSTVDSTLQSSKVQAFGTILPTFSQTDTFEPDIREDFFPLYLAEAKSACFSLFKSGSDPKVEQAARRLKSYIQNDLYRTERPNVRPKYGRT